MATKTRDYYEVLGVHRSASQAEIQRAYRALARRFHPDLNRETGAETRFKQITEAYNILSDERKRAMYDLDRGLGGFFSSETRGQRMPRFDAGVEVVEITVEEAYEGGKRHLTLEFGTAVRVVEVDVPPGVTDGRRIPLPGMDMSVTVRIAPHPRYRVQGRDIYVDLPLAPWEAALGATVPVETPAGPAQVQVPAGLSSGRRARLRGRGMPNPEGVAGDLYAEIRIVVPPRLSAGERRRWQQLAKSSDWNPRD
ncbi:cytochrome c biogenesis protein [Paractinoplanes deccanensis]|uniref:Cytochrome c biogenesis protein n=1 Tax=Paractinoplanes deccanensis TaxID=113561 RepID=A0ABQ3Y4E6_9ACTN|nr:DnaJ C-terminal domain-containing protein [Actinoplanes deccanensis]GID74853.1 cytochrome c biogenesis protein [Actinoplanes deccanensis]